MPHFPVSWPPSMRLAFLRQVFFPTDQNGDAKCYIAIWVRAPALSNRRGSRAVKVDHYTIDL
jgi:hypothetical protein